MPIVFNIDESFPSSLQVSGVASQWALGTNVFDSTGWFYYSTMWQQDLTSGGQSIEVVSSSFVVTTLGWLSYQGYADGQLVFDFSVTPTTGEYIYTQYLPLDHNNSADPNESFYLEFCVRNPNSNGGQLTFVDIYVSDSAPTASADIANVLEHTPFSGNLLTNDALGFDSNGGVVEVSINGNTVPVVAGQATVISGTYGTLTLEANGSYTYNPLSNDTNGTDVFSYTIKDGDGDPATSTLTVNVSAVNDAPTAVIFGNAVASLAENTSTGEHILIADIGLTDDTLGTNILSLAGANSGDFKVIGGQLYLKAGVPLDFEANSNLQIIVQVDDPSVGGAVDASSILTLSITDVNEAPTDIGLSPPVLLSAFSASSEAPAVSVDENAVNGTVIALPWAVDPDEGDSFDFTLLNDAGGRFALNDDNQLVVAAGGLLDYEGDQFHFIELQATDMGGNSITRTFQIAVNDVNEAPTSLTVTANNIRENSAPGVVAATLSSVDPDAGDMLTYSLVGGPGSSDNALFTVSGNRLIFNGVADYEVKPGYSVRLQVTDAAGETHQTTATIGVTNVSPEVINGTGVANILRGGSDRDVISGLGGNDVLYGYAGNDTLTGGVGRDTLYGGADRDFFVFNSKAETTVGANHDVIRDFQHGVDDIDLSTIDASSRKAGNQAFKFIGAAAFHKVAGELKAVFVNKPGTLGDYTLVSGDINGDGRADFEIQVFSPAKLSGGDFIL